MPLKSAVLSRISGIAHGFGDRPENVPADLAQIWSATTASWKQVHGTACVELTTAHQKGLEGDGFWTQVPGLAVSVVTADCVPILAARRDGRRVAALHAGWRGTQARIVSKFFELMRSQGESPSDWVAAVGPAIGPCCYEVSESLATDFQREFAPIAEQAVPRFRHLDLPLINEQELKRLGVSEVDLIRACTRCSVSDGATGSNPGSGLGLKEPLFESFRREGGTRRQYSVITINAGDKLG